jgi:Zn-dependent peptidase ImmA (M78 family)
MQAHRREQIEKLANVVREACNIDILFTDDDIKKMVILLGGECEVRQEYWCEASIQKTGDETFKIIVHEEYMPLRRKFIIAHELGHLFLHMGFLINKSKWEGRDSSQIFFDSARDRLGRSEAESEANWFASALLMPRRYFEKVAEENVKSVGGKEYYQVDKIAGHFDVSLQVALTRGRAMELFPRE